MEKSKVIQEVEDEFALRIEVEIERLSHEMTSAMHRAWRSSITSEEIEHMNIYEDLGEKINALNELRKTLCE